MPYKEVMLTAELILKPPSSMDTMFVAVRPSRISKYAWSPSTRPARPLMNPVISLNFRVRSWQYWHDKRNRMPTTRYEFPWSSARAKKGSAIKLWVPTNAVARHPPGYLPGNCYALYRPCVVCIHLK